MYAKINLIIISILFSFTLLFSQGMYYEFEDDTVVGEIPKQPGHQISSIDLTGSMDVMVMVIGFPDLSNNWPAIENNSSTHLS